MKILQSYVLVLAGVLFTIGLVGASSLRRGFLSAMLGLEIMLCAPILVLSTSGNHWDSPEGGTMCIVMLTIFAAELAVLIALLVRHREMRVDEDQAAQPSRGTAE